MRITNQLFYLKKMNIHIILWLGDLVIKVYLVRLYIQMVKICGIGAVELAKSVYSEEENYDIVSTLVYGVQWDAIINFMKDVDNPYVSGKKYIQNGKGMGWWQYKSTTNSSRKTGIDLNENSSNMIKNIYDMAGNISEWTMEALPYFGERITRGGESTKFGSIYSISCRDSLNGNSGYTQVTTEAYAEYLGKGFRVALYIK